MIINRRSSQFKGHQPSISRGSWIRQICRRVNMPSRWRATIWHTSPVSGASRSSSSIPRHSSPEITRNGSTRSIPRKGPSWPFRPGNRCTCSSSTKSPLRITPEVWTWFLHRFDRSARTNTTTNAKRERRQPLPFDASLTILVARAWRRSRCGGRGTDARSVLAKITVQFLTRAATHNSKPRPNSMLELPTGWSPARRPSRRRHPLVWPAARRPTCSRAALRRRGAATVAPLRPTHVNARRSSAWDSLGRPWDTTLRVLVACWSNGQISAFVRVPLAAIPPKIAGRDQQSTRLPPRAVVLHSAPSHPPAARGRPNAAQLRFTPTRRTLVAALTSGTALPRAPNSRMRAMTRQLHIAPAGGPLSRQPPRHGPHSWIRRAHALERAAHTRRIITGSPGRRVEAAQSSGGPSSNNPTAVARAENCPPVRNLRSSVDFKPRQIG